MKYRAIIALTTILAGLGASVALSAEAWRDHGDRREPEYVDQPSITLFERPGFQGKSHTFRGDQSDLGDTNFNDHASSAQVHGRWRVCGDSKMRGRCEDLFRDIPDLKAIGLDPAQCSNIILTTVTDVVGFLAFLGFAVLFQNYLV